MRSGNPHKKHSRQRLLTRPTLLLIFALSANSQQLATGKVLVATEKSHDPDFARSLVLLIHYDSEAAIGLMLNKPTAVRISEILPEVKAKSITIYAGGPIAIGVRCLLQSKTRPFFTVISGKTEILRVISSGAPPDSFRLYAGYTGWTARQLQSEVARGLWKVLLANRDTLWRRTEQLPGLTPPGRIR